MAELVRLFFGELKEKGDEELAKKAFHECHDYTVKRERCWNTLTEENRNQECFPEELEEKKCLALCLCPELYKKFYEYTECHLWAAAFRNKNDVRYMEARKKIDNNPAMATMCREMGHDLTSTISRYTRFRPEALEGESFLKKEGVVR